MRGRARLSLFLFSFLLALVASLAGCTNIQRGEALPAGLGGPAPVSITVTSVPDGVNAQAYNQTVTVSGGTAPLTYSVSAGALPDGLILDPATGAITGTPTTPGTFNFTIQVTDSSTPAQTATIDLTIIIAEPLAITTASLPNGTDGVAYNQTVTTTGGEAPLTFSLSSGALPGGLALDMATGAITGTPTAGGTFNFTIQAADSLNPQQTASQAYAVFILQITTTSLPNGSQGQAYGPEVLGVAGQVDPVNWTVSAGALPTGLNLNAATGEISGTPTAAGSFNFTAQVTDSDAPARTDTQALSIDIVAQLNITTTSLLAATEAVAYNENIQATGGTAPYVWSEPTASFDAGGVGAATTPCEGLTFDVGATGLATTLSGTPVNVGTCGPFTARIDDSSIPALFDEQALSIIVNAAGPPPGQIGVIERISVATDGTQGNEHSTRPVASGDARYVAFESDATNLVAGDTNNFADVFVRDRQTSQTVRVSVASDGSQATLDGGHVPSISNDGRYVAFASFAGNLVAVDTNASGDTFVHDRDVSGNGVFDEPGDIATVLLSVASDGTQGNGDNSSFGCMSADGRFVTFNSRAANLVANDTNATSDVFIHDRDTDNDGIFDEPGAIATVRVSVASDGTEGDDLSFNVRQGVSDDGRFVAFVSDATNLVANDTNGVRDVFVHDRDTDADGIFDEAGAIATVRVSVASDGTQANGGLGGLLPPAISPDGRFVAFGSAATNLVANDTNGFLDAFVHDRDTDADGIFDEPGAIATIRVSVDSNGVEGNGSSFDPSMSPDGRLVAFASGASNLVANDTFGLVDIFVHDRDDDNDGIFDEPGAIATVRVSVTSTGAEAVSNSAEPFLPRDTISLIVFNSFASNFVAGDTNVRRDIFLAGTGE